MTARIRLLILSAMVAALVNPGLSAAAGDIPDYQPDEFNVLFLTAPLPGLHQVGPAPAITGSSVVDGRIRALAEGRGYLRRPLAIGPLAAADGVPVQPALMRAWEALQADAAAHGYSISLQSGFRNHGEQVSIFVGKLSGTSDAAIETRLRTAAPPGYSKHHTGYAIDISAPGSGFTAFGSTRAFAWLSADNAEAAKRNGFIPSYPNGASSQGPNPEPWEWTYVGVEVIECGRNTLGVPVGSFDDAVSCPGYPLGRGSAAHLLVRALGLAGSPLRADAFTDDDGLSYESDIDLLAGLDLATGCDATSFCPFIYPSRGELASMVVEALSLVSVEPDGSSFDDIDTSEHADDIRRLDRLGLVDGCGERSFCPEQRSVRGDLVDLVIAGRASGLVPPVSDFADMAGSDFEIDARWLAQREITKGCNPPFGDLFCPDDSVTRGQMAAFLVRALALSPGSTEFSDTGGSVFAADASALAEAGITRGCNPPANDAFCPDDPVTRGQMAAFLVRALDLNTGSTEFSDTGGSVFAADASALAEAGITRGCNPPANDAFCPDDPVTRGQMAAFLHRALASE